MDQDKVLLEMFGKVSATETIVLAIKEDISEAKKERIAMWKKLDSQGRIITYGLGCIGTIFVGLKIYGEKIKNFLFGA